MSLYLFGGVMISVSVCFRNIMRRTCFCTWLTVMRVCTAHERILKNQNGGKGTDKKLWVLTDKGMEYKQWCGDVFIVLPLLIHFVRRWDFSIKHQCGIKGCNRFVFNSYGFNYIKLYMWCRYKCWSERGDESDIKMNNWGQFQERGTEQNHPTFPWLCLRSDSSVFNENIIFCKAI